MESTAPKLALTPIFLLFGLASAQFPEIYDFVIVGGGPAGCTLASRLTENGKHTVLLLEAGGVPHPDFEIPGVAFRSPHFVEQVRTYQSVPQKQAGLANDGIVEVSVGRVIGGGSSINGMVWNRGSPFDFDNWARLTNDSSWRYDSLLDYFKKTERYAGQFPSDHHGVKGPITISQPRYSPLRQEWLDAGLHLGIPNGDPNGPQRVGFAPIEFSKRYGRRVSAYEGYLKPAMSRKNLRVITEAEVSQILFQGRRAAGVRFRTKSGTRKVLARKEVIVSAGAIESPALLLRSGIGPSQVLQSARIPQLVELPVGANLQNHPVLPLLFALNKSSIFIPSRDLTPGAMKIFNAFGDGPYSTAGGDFGEALLESTVSTKPGWADIILYFFQDATRYLQGIQSSTVSQVADWEAPIALLVSVARPRSAGRVTINPQSPDDPVVDFQHFSNPKDMQVMLEAIKFALDTLEKTPQFQKVGARLLPLSLDACENLGFRSDEYWRCHVRQVSTNLQHPSSTCRMGRGPEDRDAVVDTKLQVLGVEGLRVIDASIMPVITNANLMAPVFAIAEKAVDMILHSWI